MPEYNCRRLSCCVTAISALFLACSADSDDPNRRSGSGRLPAAGVIGQPGSGGASGGAWPTPNPQLAGNGSNPTPTTRAGDETNCAAISQQAENERKPADIIFAVDNSGSMNDEIAFVREQLNAFSQQIVQSGVDVRIILISSPLSGTGPGTDVFDDNGICITAPLGSGTCPEDSKAPGYFHVPEEVGSSDALNLFISEFPRYQAQLRPNATKTFVVVTDDDADDRPNDSPAAFSQSVMNLPGNLFSSWSLSGIYCFTDCRDAAEIGTVYNGLVQQTKGVAGDLCLQDFAPVFDALAKAVIGASGLDCAWDIPAPPTGQTFNRQQVNVQYATQGASARNLLQVSNAGACATRSGWYYDDTNDPKRILACPATCGELQNDLQAKVDVLFGCDTQLAPQ